MKVVRMGGAGHMHRTLAQMRSKSQRSFLNELYRAPAA